MMAVFEYEASKLWLQEHFDRYFVNIRWDDKVDKERPVEVIISGIMNVPKQIAIGRGITFDSALDGLISQLGLPIIPHDTDIGTVENYLSSDYCYYQSDSLLGDFYDDGNYEEDM